MCFLMVRDDKRNPSTLHTMILGMRGPLGVGPLGPTSMLGVNTALAAAELLCLCARRTATTLKHGLLLYPTETPSHTSSSQSLAPAPCSILSAALPERCTSRGRIHPGLPAS